MFKYKMTEERDDPTFGRVRITTEAIGQKLTGWQRTATLAVIYVILTFVASALMAIVLVDVLPGDYMSRWSACVGLFNAFMIMRIALEIYDSAHEEL